MRWNNKAFTFPTFWFKAAKVLLFTLRHLACFPKDFICLLWLGFIKVILMVNIKKVNIIVFVFHFHACWPLNSLDRLLCFWQQHGNFFRPLTFKMWGSSLQHSALAFTLRSRPLMLSGWHSEADGRVGQDCLQMFFWGPTVYLIRGCGA